jgi:hypothetical protein
MVELCRGYPIARHPQKTLLGFALTSKRTNTLMDCIEFCFMHNKNFTTGVSPAAGRKLAFEGGGESSEEAKHVKCRSIMFYYEVLFC